ncbi:sigma-70 family RNA polymerase sigma factor [Candidatus Parcubacteria bacterium]|jgi:RNA polymerase sigma-70 factor (ECF subfamily)|nr:MAG: sigma-70 family RNA polymerase sigma factor [Candidatus Parcubacteria bacterium]
MKSEEEILIKRAKSGDHAAFQALYDQYVVQIYRFVFLKVGQKQDAEDLTQHVFVNAWENIPSYEHRGFPFSSWLYRIASNATVDHFRTGGRTVDIENIPEEYLGGDENQEDAVDTAIEVETIKAVLTKLEPDQQSVLIMKFIEDKTNKEIAESLQKSEGAIRVIQHRALKQLKTLIHARRNN